MQTPAPDIEPSGISRRRRIFYFYTLLVLGSIAGHQIKLSRVDPPNLMKRVAKANELVNQLFR